MANLYVTFQIKPTFMGRALGIKTKYYAIKCETYDEATDVALDINSLDGVTYLRINKCGKLSRKDVKILPSNDYIKHI